MGTVHASCVRIGDLGVLLRGPSGSGKSDSALRLMDAGAVLVADDRVELWMEGGRVMAKAPPVLAGLLEVRGVGILAMPYTATCVVDLVIDLVDRARVERWPDASAVSLLGTALPLLALDPFESSFVAKVKAALTALSSGRLGKAPGEP